MRVFYHIIVKSMFFDTVSQSVKNTMTILYTYAPLLTVRPVQFIKIVYTHQIWQKEAQVLVIIKNHVHLKQKNVLKLKRQC
jgi:hypothetical protein